MTEEEDRIAYSRKLDNTNVFCESQSVTSPVKINPKQIKKGTIEE